MAARETTTSQLARLLDNALAAMAESIRVAADKGAAAAVEYIADYLNGVDAVEEGDDEAYQRWVAKGKP